MGEWYGGSMPLNDCSFQTDRMEVDDWSLLLTGDSAEQLRNTFLVSLLSEAATRELPPGWQGPYDQDRASSWFAERRSEGTVLLIAERSDGRPVGLVMLAESEHIDGHLDIRMGYLIHESAWGRGLATEVVAGFADWCRTKGTVRSIVGGVTDGNVASARVLLRNGFVPAKGSDPHDEVQFTLILNP